MRFDVEADDNALLASTSLTKEISGFTNVIKNSINNTGFGFVFSSDNAQDKGKEIKNITVYKARNLLNNGTQFEPIYKTLVVTYIERMLRFYSGDFKQDKILKFFSKESKQPEEPLGCRPAKISTLFFKMVMNWITPLMRSMESVMLW